MNKQAIDRKSYIFLNMRLNRDLMFHLNVSEEFLQGLLEGFDSKEIETAKKEYTKGYNIGTKIIKKYKVKYDLLWQ